jgi:hypothetical protein
VIQRLYYRDRASGRVELGANSLQAREGMRNTVVLAVEHGLREAGEIRAANRSRLLLQWLQGADDHVMVVRESKEIRSFRRAHAGNMMNRLG